MSTQIERHNWSEADEKSLMSTVKWVEEHISNAAIKERGGKWKVVAGLLFTDVSLKVTDNACRKRHADIKKRINKRKDNGKEVVEYLGTDFPQVGEQTEEEKLRARVAVLERKVDNLINSLNEFSGIVDDIKKIADSVNKNTVDISKKVGKEHWHKIYQFSSRTGDAICAE
ncbi:MAG: hypothetical protein ACXADB_08485 [Candidatus Hermodarchaeia archaeon]|jgi:hypothetical protein